MASTLASDGAGVKGSTRLSPANEEGDKKDSVTMRRRALLVGIAYSSPSNTWSPLDGPHDDVDRYRGLLLSA
jgi:hypothetical protein